MKLTTLLILTIHCALAQMQGEYSPAEGFSANAHGQPVPGLVLKLAAAKAQFGRGEPVEVTLELQNRSNRNFLIRWEEGVFPYIVMVDRQGKNGGPFFDAVAKTAEGEKVLGPNPLPHRSNVRTLIKDNVSRGVPICISCCFDVTQPGKYRVRFARVFPSVIKGRTERVVSNEVMITVAP